ncbi:MAG: CorA family divalent cation transporter, partial [Syntrophales bacterium]|nr:CorA family divalent cation transporter [Syntrophales bacterium]
GLHHLTLEDILNTAQRPKMEDFGEYIYIVLRMFLTSRGRDEGIIAGVYGMNFKYMPELELRWGYYTVWIIMISIVITMMFYFKRKKWL